MGVPIAGSRRSDGNEIFTIAPHGNVLRLRGDTRQAKGDLVWERLPHAKFGFLSAPRSAVGKSLICRGQFVNGHLRKKERSELMALCLFPPVGASGI